MVRVRTIISEPVVVPGLSVRLQIRAAASASVRSSCHCGVRLTGKRTNDEEHEGSRNHNDV